VIVIAFYGMVTDKAHTVDGQSLDTAPAMTEWNSYEDLVRAQQISQPSLGALVTFMGLTKTPEPRHSFDIHVRHILDTGETGDSLKFADRNTFDQAFYKPPKGRIGSIILIENLTCEAIEAVGLKLKLKPEFFADYIFDTEPFMSGRFEYTHVRTTKLAPSFRSLVEYYSVEYTRAYRFPNGRKEMFELRSRITSTPRPMKIQHSLHAFTHEKVSGYRTTIDGVIYGQFVN
jgi:hypothetical protein